MTDRLLAIDIGTQSARAAVLTVDGHIVGIAQIAHEVYRPHPSWAQQQPEQWWKEVCQAIREVLRETCVSADAIAAIGTCGQMHGPVGIDDSGQVTTPWVQLWCDKRCASQVEAVRTRDDAATLVEIAGSAPNPAWMGLKVRWHKDNEPDAYRRARWFLVPKDFVNYRLTGVAAADASEASGSFLWDGRRDTYSPRLADAVGVELEKFAPVLASHAVIGEVTRAVAEQTGLRSGTPVVAGGGDFPVSMLGFGLVGEGVTADVTGTSTLLAAHAAHPLLDPTIQNLRHVVPGWIPFTLLDCGGLSMSWCRDLVRTMAGREVEFDEMIALASGVPAGSDGLLFLPYMSGERRHDNTLARGGYCGLTLNHQTPHFIRAVMEGVAFAMGKDVRTFRACGREVTRVYSVGGGTRNLLWNQIKADVMQVPLELSDEPEAGLQGAALLAAAGVGLISDPGAEALRRRKPLCTITPDRAASARYQAAQAEFIRVYEHMLGFWQLC
jgi:sugar (pentulose or hexulose) kinase